MLDTNGAGLSHFRLGVEGDADAGGIQHGQIIGAIADGQGLVWLKRQPQCKRGKRLTFGLSAEDGVGNFAGEFAIGGDQGI